MNAELWLPWLAILSASAALPVSVRFFGHGLLNSLFTFLALGYWAVVLAGA